MLAQQSAGETAPCSCATTCEPSRAHSRLSTLILPVRVAQVPFSTAARTLVCDDAERHVGTSAHMPPTLCIARPFRSRLAPQLPLRRCASRRSIAGVLAARDIAGHAGVRCSSLSPAPIGRPGLPADGGYQRVWASRTWGGANAALQPVSRQPCARRPLHLHCGAT
jgi:hypothetical protein